MLMQFERRNLLIADGLICEDIRRLLELAGGGLCCYVSRRANMAAPYTCARWFFIWYRFVLIGRISY